MDKFNDWVIQPNNQRINLKNAIDLILDFNEKLNQIWFECIKNIKVGEQLLIGVNSQKILTTLCK